MHSAPSAEQAAWLVDTHLGRRQLPQLSGGNHVGLSQQGQLAHGAVATAQLLSRHRWEDGKHWMAS